MDPSSIKVRDFIFPISLCRVSDSKQVEFVQCLGTGFYIGRSGLALTAKHVVNIIYPDYNYGLVAMFVDDSNEWTSRNCHIIANHPTEDATLLQIGNLTNISFGLTPCFEPQFSGKDYSLFGYPYINFYEDDSNMSHKGSIIGRPDMIFSKGYIRRRTSFKLPNIRGSELYELSSPAGAGCSGSPIFNIINKSWQAIGIYIADKIQAIGFEHYDKDLNWSLQTIEFGGNLAYATRMDALADWDIRSGLSFRDICGS